MRTLTSTPVRGHAPPPAFRINGGATRFTMKRQNCVVFFSPRQDIPGEQIRGIPPGYIRSSDAVQVYKEAVIGGQVDAVLCVCNGEPMHDAAVHLWVLEVKAQVEPLGLTASFGPCEGGFASQWYALNKLANQRR